MQKSPSTSNISSENESFKGSRKSVIANSSAGHLSKKKSQSIMGPSKLWSSGSPKTMPDTSNESFQFPEGPLEIDRLMEMEKSWFDQLSLQLDLTTAQNQSIKDQNDTLIKQLNYLKDTLENERAIRKRLENELEREKSFMVGFEEKLTESNARREDIIQRFSSEIENEKASCIELLQQQRDDKTIDMLNIQTFIGKGKSKGVYTYSSGTEKRATNSLLESRLSKDSKINKIAIENSNSFYSVRTKSESSLEGTLLGSKEPSYQQGIDQILTDNNVQSQEKVNNPEKIGKSDEAIQSSSNTDQQQQQLQQQIPLQGGSETWLNSRDDILNNYKEYESVDNLRSSRSALVSPSTDILNNYCDYPNKEEMAKMTDDVNNFQEGNTPEKAQ